MVLRDVVAAVTVAGGGAASRVGSCVISEISQYVMDTLFTLKPLNNGQNKA